MATKSDEELYDVVHAHAEDYTEEAIEAAQGELRARNLEAPVPEAVAGAVGDKLRREQGGGLPLLESSSPAIPDYRTSSGGIVRRIKYTFYSVASLCLALLYSRIAILAPFGPRDALTGILIVPGLDGLAMGLLFVPALYLQALDATKVYQTETDSILVIIPMGAAIADAFFFWISLILLWLHLDWVMDIFHGLLFAIAAIGCYRQSYYLIKVVSRISD